MDSEKRHISQEELRSKLREFDRQLADLRIKTDAVKNGKGEFFSWPVFGLGLIVVAGLMAPFVFSVSAWLSIFSAVALVAAIGGLLARRSMRRARGALEKESGRDAT